MSIIQAAIHKRPTTYNHHDNNENSSSRPPDLPGLELYQDPDSQRWYYYDPETQVSTWKESPSAEQKTLTRTMSDNVRKLLIDVHLMKYSVYLA
jgi:hypothetical protein